MVVRDGAAKPDIGSVEALRSTFLGFLEDAVNRRPVHRLRFLTPHLEYLLKASLLASAMPRLDLGMAVPLLRRTVRGEKTVCSEAT